MAEANTSSTQQAADAQHVDNMTSMQQSTPDAPSGARSDAPVQTNNVGAQDGPSQLNSNPTGNSANNANLGGGTQNSGLNGALSGNLGGTAGPGGGDAGGAGGALNGLAGNLGGTGNAGGEAGQGGAENAGGGSGGSGGVGGGGAGNAGAVAGAGAGARGAGGVGGGGAGDAGGGEASANGTSAGGGEGGGGSAPPATASAPTSPANTTIPFDALTAEELAIAAIEANDASISSGEPIFTVTEAGGIDNAIAGTPSVSNTLISVDGSAFIAVTTAAASELGFGTYTINADGEWIYTLISNSNTTIQDLNVGDILDDTFTVTTLDGVEETVTVRIVGANDSAVISGVTSAVLESAVSAVGGALTSVDIDNIDNSFIAQSSTLGSNGHGSFTLNADGTWSYLKNPTTPFTVSSNTDSFVASSIDGTQKIVTVTGVQDGLTQYSFGAFSLGYTDTNDLSFEDYSYGTFISQSNVGGGGNGVVSITPEGYWYFTQLILPSSSNPEYVNNFSLPFNYSVEGITYTENIELTITVGYIANRYVYNTSTSYPDDLTSNTLASNYIFNTSFTGLQNFGPTDHINLLAQGVLEGVTAVASADAGNIGVLTLDAYGNYTYSINQVPVDSFGRYSSVAPAPNSFNTQVLNDFTGLFYQYSDHTDTFDVIRDGNISTQVVNIGNTIIGTVINDKPGGVDYSDRMSITGNLGLAAGSQNVQIISGADSSNFYATNIGSLTLNTDGSYSYEINSDASIASYTHFDTFLVSSTVGNAINIQALEFNILQEGNTKFIGSSGSITGTPGVNDVFLFDYGVPNSINDSYSHVINNFNVEEDRINISKLLTSSSDQLSGTIYIDLAGDNSRSEIRVNHSGSDFTVIEIDGVSASIPELMWNDETRSAPVTSLNAVTNWTETLEISGVSYDGSKKFTADGGWALEIISGTIDDASSDIDTLVFTGGAGEVVISQTIGDQTFILQDISHVDKINWS